MEELKPGKYSTEFVLTVISKLAGFAVLFGVVTEDQATELPAAIEAAANAIAGLVLVLVPYVQYIKSRTALKAK